MISVYTAVHPLRMGDIMSKKKKIIIICIIAGVLLIAAAAVLGILFLGGEANGVYVDSVANITGINLGTNTYSGIAEASNIITIELDGEKTLDVCYVQEGDRVKKGDKLFSYDAEDLELKHQQLVIDCETSKNNITTMEGQITELEREKRYAPASEKAQYTIQIQTLELNIKQENHALEKKMTELKASEEAIANNVVVSEADGVVSKINYSPSSATGEPAPFMTILADGDLTVTGTASEQTVHTLYEGMRVRVRSRVDDTVWMGTIESIDLSQPVDTPNGSAMMYGYDTGAETASRYTFKVKLDSAEGLLIGQHIFIEPGETAGGMWLSEYYLIDGTANVYAVNSIGRIERRTVELGAYDSNACAYEILSGLTAEDHIAFPDGNVSVGAKAIIPQEPEIFPEADTVVEGSTDIPSVDMSFSGAEVY